MKMRYLVKMESTVHQVKTDRMALQELMVPQDPQEQLAFQAPWDHKVKLENQERTACQEWMELLELMEHQEQLAQMELQDQLERREWMELQEPWDQWEKLVQ